MKRNDESEELRLGWGRARISRRFRGGRRFFRGEVGGLNGNQEVCRRDECIDGQDASVGGVSITKVVVEVADRV